MSVCLSHFCLFTKGLVGQIFSLKVGMTNIFKQKGDGDADVHGEEDASETNFIEKSKLSAGARILRGP